MKTVFKNPLTILAVVFVLLIGVMLVSQSVGSPLPHDLLAGLGALGTMPFLVGETSTLGEQIKAYEAQRQLAADEMDNIMKVSSDEGRTLKEDEEERYETRKREISSIDKHLARLKEHEKTVVAKARKIEQNTEAGDGAVEVDGLNGKGSNLISVKTNLPKGLQFTRFSLAMAQAKGNVMMAHEIAKGRWKDSPEVANMLKQAISLGGTSELARVSKAAVTAVSSTDTALTQYQDLQDQFIELLRPKTILGRMTQLTEVPFNSRQGRQLTGVTGSFVGEGAPKPVQKQTCDNVTLAYAKVAVIVVLTDEAVRFNTIKAEMRARDDMVKGVSTYLDKRFMDPAYSGVANVSPASITNGARRVQSSGTTLAAIDADVRSAMAEFSTSDVDPSTAVWVMPASVALRLSMKRTTQDEKAYPELTMMGGTWYGLPVIISNAMVATGSPAELQIALVTQEEVLMADDGSIAIDMSNEASVQMNDAPSAGAQSLVSLWQNNLIGLRAERYINWAPRRTSSLGIVLIENTNY